jgi:cytochrome b involved in lipid metabolism
MNRSVTTAVIAAGLMAGAALTAVPAQAAPARTVTKAEVARHATSSDCWIIVGRSVYDVTTYIPRHPGGPGQITRLCGGQATAAFTGQHAGDGSALRALATLRIGKLKG